MYRGGGMSSHPALRLIDTFIGSLILLSPERIYAQKGWKSITEPGAAPWPSPGDTPYDSCGFAPKLPNSEAILPNRKLILPNRQPVLPNQEPDLPIWNPFFEPPKIVSTVFSESYHS
jgi:hypothetical protein